ncbi:MAG: Gfo/Idh/MocA family oxidoreductase [Deltaproteobacteria bacterium]|nr:Gfo/Idh/MocA family oxidoreductase [Deltaproteobacteria bacterium]
MTAASLRVAVIGAGAWGLNHVRVVASEHESVLVAVVDPDPIVEGRVRAIASGVQFLRDADQVFASDAIDAVVIASPASSHAALACAALRANKHVLIEKPLAMNLRDATTIVAAARERRKVAMVGHLMVHHPAVVRLRELLHSGALGTLHYLHSTRVNLGRIRSDENALWSFGPHDLSMIDFLLERTPSTVSARGQCVLQPGVEDVVFLTLRYSTGETAHIHLSWLSPRKERRLTLVCSQKMVEFDDVATDKLRIFDKGYDRPQRFTEYGQYLTLRDGDVHIPQLPMQEPLRVQWQHFVRCIRDGATPTTDLQSAVRVISVLEAAQRSLAQDGVPMDVQVSDLA